MNSSKVSFNEVYTLSNIIKERFALLEQNLLEDLKNHFIGKAIKYGDAIYSFSNIEDCKINAASALSLSPAASTINVLFTGKVIKAYKGLIENRWSKYIIDDHTTSCGSVTFSLRALFEDKIEFVDVDLVNKNIQDIRDIEKFTKDMNGKWLFKGDEVCVARYTAEGVSMYINEFRVVPRWHSIFGVIENYNEVTKKMTVRLFNDLGTMEIDAEKLELHHHAN